MILQMLLPVQLIVPAKLTDYLMLEADVAKIFVKKCKILEQFFSLTILLRSNLNTIDIIVRRTKKIQFDRFSIRYRDCNKIFCELKNFEQISLFCKNINFRFPKFLKILAIFKFCQFVKNYYDW